MDLFKKRTFIWQEMLGLKVLLLSIGILLGLYFTDYLAAYLSLWWALAVLTGAYFISRFLQGK